jgi:hypothetical protein
MGNASFDRGFDGPVGYFVKAFERSLKVLRNEAALFSKEKSVGDSCGPTLPSESVSQRDYFPYFPPLNPTTTSVLAGLRVLL